MNRTTVISLLAALLSLGAVAQTTREDIVGPIEFTVGPVRVPANTCMPTVAMRLRRLTDCSTVRVRPPVYHLPMPDPDDFPESLFIVSWPTRDTFNYQVCNRTDSLVRYEATTRFVADAYLSKCAVILDQPKIKHEVTEQEWQELMQRLKALESK
jgi:hypothetical protein